MTFQAAQIDPSAFRPFSLAKAFQEGQQVRENEMTLQDQSNMMEKKRQLSELFQSANGDLMNPEVQAKWSQIDPVSQQEYMGKIQKMAAERSDHIEGATKKMAAILSSLPPDKRTPEYEAQVISDYKNSLMSHDPWIAHAIPTDPAGIQRIKEFGGYQTPEQARQAKLQDLQDKAAIELSQQNSHAQFTNSLPPTQAQQAGWNRDDAKQKAGFENQIKLKEMELGNKSATESQSNAAGYGLRATDADAALDAMTSASANGEAAQYDPTGWGARKDVLADTVGWNSARSDAGQTYDSIARNFIAAVLRKESGATMPDSEIESYKKIYIPQPGDSAQVIAQKKHQRKLAIQALQVQSGPSGIPEPLARSASPVTKTGIDQRTGKQVTLILRNGQWVPQ